MSNAKWYVAVAGAFLVGVTCDSAVDTALADEEDCTTCECGECGDCTCPETECGDLSCPEVVVERARAVLYVHSSGGTWDDEVYTGDPPCFASAGDGRTDYSDCCPDGFSAVGVGTHGLVCLEDL